MSVVVVLGLVSFELLILLFSVLLIDGAVFDDYCA
jgi:hypothetical protein